jgi:hypothetical protein
MRNELHASRIMEVAVKNIECDDSHCNAAQHIIVQGCPFCQFYNRRGNW